MKFIDKKLKMGVLRKRGKIAVSSRRALGFHAKFLRETLNGIDSNQEVIAQRV